MFYFGSSLACLVYKKADLCLPVKQLTLQTQGEDAEKVFCLKFRTQQSPPKKENIQTVDLPFA